MLKAKKHMIFGSLFISFAYISMQYNSLFKQRDVNCNNCNSNKNNTDNFIHTKYQPFMLISSNFYIKSLLQKSVDQIQQHIFQPIYELDTLSFEVVSKLYNMDTYKTYLCKDTLNNEAHEIFNSYLTPLYHFLEDRGCIKIAYMEGLDGRSCADFHCNTLSTFSPIAGDFVFYKTCTREYKAFAGLSENTSYNAQIYDKFKANLYASHPYFPVDNLELTGFDLASVKAPNNYTKTKSTNDILLCPTFFLTQHNLTLIDVILHEMHHSISNGDDEIVEIGYSKKLCIQHALKCDIEITAKDPTCFSMLFENVL